ncbi:MAG: GAF domain-containing protein [Notoacmeibacter sp.]|nr:GAF domain-containing protein [Notoacmeibacter sp.]
MASSHHADLVIETVRSPSAAAVSRLAASWRRSLVNHGLDPAQQHAPERIEAATLRLRRSALERFMTIAAPKLDHLFGLVGNSGCCVLLTDRDGIVLDQRSTDADARVFQDWGLWSGAVWSEAAEGTNGIGTCLAEQRQVVIHRGEHFLARNTMMSCMDAPIYGADGKVLAALDVSSCRTDQTEAFTRLIAATVSQAARQIETDNFRASFPQARIIDAADRETESATLLAVDDDDLVIGATRAARRAFGLGSEGTIRPRPASDILGRTEGPSGLEKAERAALVRAIARADGNLSAAARALGIGRATLYRRMKNLDLN